MEIADIYPENFNNVDFSMENDDRKKFEYYYDYYKLHSSYIIPTTIKIDLDLFENEIKEYHHMFRRWGNNRNYLPRYGISLVNYDGKLDGEIDIAAAPLDMLNKERKEKLQEDDFTKKTEVFYNLNSLRPLDPIKNFLIRSNILLWHKNASFLPHIDTVPQPWGNLRLWGVSNPDKYKFDFRGRSCMNIEAGRIYLIDTTVFHSAHALDDWIYTFFIALKQSKETFNWLKNNLC
jgi:hypothetical protein